MKPLLQIDLEKVIDASVAPSKKFFIPVGLLKRIIRENDLNQLLRQAYPAEGSAFSENILNQLNITLSVDMNSIDQYPEKRLIFVSNHPLGGLDGIALVKVLGEMYGDDNVRVLVNNLLMHVAPLSSMFVPINKYGSQGRETAKEINALYSSDKNICIFPAGLVSRLQQKGEIKDLKWQKAFVVKALEYNRTIVPIKFEALNSRKFYRIAKLRKQLGIKVNIEQALLPGEIFSSVGKDFKIKFGEPITADKLRAMGKSPSAVAQKIKEIVYSL